MKKLVLIVTLLSSWSAFSQVEVLEVNEAKVLKVSEVTVKTTCKDVSSPSDSADPVYYDCKVGTIQSFIKKKLGNVVRYQAMDSLSQSVLTNSVDNEGEYTVRVRAFFY